MILIGIVTFIEVNSYENGMISLLQIKKTVGAFLFPNYIMSLLTRGSGKDTLPREWEDIC